MKLYQYSKCGTCRNAVKLLKELNVEYESIDITVQPPTKDELRIMLASYDGELRKLFNVSGIQYRELNMKERLPAMSDDDAIALLSTNGKLVKRPFVLDREGGLVGFKDDEWRGWLMSR